MYKLLLATDRQEIRDVFAQVESWEALGFRTPRIADSVQSAIACLEAHHVDAIAFRFPPEEAAVLHAYLQESHPIMPIFQTAYNKKDQIVCVKELRSLLNRTHADFSNDNFGEADMMMLCRHEFLRALLSEKIEGEEEVRSRLQLLRSRMDPDQACVLVEIDLPHGEEYMAARWRYGSERLEIALRNFFGSEMNGMRMLTSVISPSHIRLLACPVLGSHHCEHHAESATGMVLQHAEESIEHVKAYMDLDMHISGIRVLPSLVHLTKEKMH